MTELLPRRQALHHLREMIAVHPITVVYGGAGTGKSALLEQVFAFDGVIDESSCVFVRFTPNDNTHKNFLKRLALAVNLAAMPSYGSIEVIAQAIDTLPPGVIIVIDDFHDVAHNRAFSDYLGQLIERSTNPEHHLPRRWVIAMRRLNDLALGSWLGLGRVALMNAEKTLAFTQQELRELCQMRGMDDTPNLHGNVRSVMLHLALITAGKLEVLAARKDQPVMSRGEVPKRPHYTLIATLVSRLERRLQEFLYTTCLLEEIDLHDLLANTDIDTSAIKQLSQLGILHYDNVLGGLRYDESVVEYLQETLAYCPVALINAATRHAASAGSRRAHIEVGFRALKEHEAWQAIVDILEEHGLHLLDHEPVHGCVKTALGSLPSEVLKDEPIAAGIYGALTARVGFGDVSESWFQNSLAHPKLTGNIKRHIQYRYALEVVRRERADAIDILAPLSEELEQDATLDPDLRALVRIVMAVIAAQQGDSKLAEQRMNAALEADTLAFDDSTHARVHHGAAYILLRLSRATEAIPYADKAIHFAERDGFYDLAAWCTSVRQELAWSIEHDALKCIDHLRRLEYLAWLSEDARMMLYAAVAIYWMAVEVHNYGLYRKKASEINRFEAVDDFMQHIVRLTLVPGAAYGHAWEGRFTEAIELLTQYAPLSRPGHHQAYRWSELALLHAAQYSRSKETPNYLSAVTSVRSTLEHLRRSERKLVHENDVLLRLCLATIVLRKWRFAQLLIQRIHDAQHADHRSFTMANSLTAIMHYWQGPGELFDVINAVKELRAHHLGGVAQLIHALPDPQPFIDDMTEEEIRQDLAFIEQYRTT